MSKSAKASLVYGIYAFVVGLGFLIMPNLVFGLFGVPHTHEPWIRVAGMLLFGIGVYYILVAFKQLTDFMQ
jgi:hypothetical protein